MTLFLGFCVVLLKFTGFFLATVLCSNWARPLGGLVYAGLTFPLRIQGVRKFYSALVNGVIELSFLFKLTGLVISSSGPLWPLLLLEQFYPSALVDRAVLWGIFAGLTGVSLSIMHRVHTMELPPFYQHFAAVRKYVSFDLDRLPSFDKMRLARTHFLDMSLVDLLLLIACYGLSLYCADMLGMFGIPTHQTVWEGLENGFFFLRIPIGGPQAALNASRIVISGYYGISLFIFTAFFISLASRMVDEKPPTDEENIEAAIKGALEQLSSSKGEQVAEADGPIG